jgi:uncharacterized protein YbjT (DUF2867 family)
VKQSNLLKVERLFYKVVARPRFVIEMGAAAIIVAVSAGLLGFVMHAGVRPFWLAPFVAYVALAAHNLRASSTINQLEITGKERETSAIRAADLFEAETKSQRDGTAYTEQTSTQYREEIQDYNANLGSLKTIAAAFNVEAENNTDILIIASGSLFVAAVISFMQGVGVV